VLWGCGSSQPACRSTAFAHNNKASSFTLSCEQQIVSQSFARVSRLSRASLSWRFCTYGRRDTYARARNNDGKPHRQTPPTRGLCLIPMGGSNSPSAATLARCRR